MVTRYLLPAVAVVAFGFAVIQMTKAQQKPPPASPPVEPARSPYPATVSGAGIVEPETENIAAGTHLPGVVAAVHVRVGQRVRAGDPLFELDDRQLRAEWAARAAALEAARAQREKVRQVRRPEEVAPYRTRVDEAAANLKDKEVLYVRAKRGATAAAFPEEELVQREQAVAMAKAQLARAEADLTFMAAPVWTFDLAVAEAAVTQAEAQLRQTETELDRLKVTAPRTPRPGADDPVEFRVLQVNVRPGEYVAATAGPALVALGAVGRLHVRADIDENDIGRFRPGIPGTATPRGDTRKGFPLTFVRVEPFVVPKKSLTGGNTERVDTRVLQVIYAVDAPDPGLYVGQQVDVTLDAAAPGR
jgi:multidrug efflux pump subunit AcrA (membrane-fusion protein)